MSKLVEYVDLSKDDKDKLRSWIRFERVASDPNAASRERKTAEEKAKQEPHLDNQKIMTGCIVKGVCNYVYLTDSEVENVSRSATYYALNGWHYLGDQANSGKAEIYARNKDKFECYEFYNNIFQPNFYESYPKSKINIANINKALTNKRTKAPHAYLKIAKSIHNAEDNTGIGQALPYKWEAHHILPMTCFYKAFTENQREVIRYSDFDINHGRFIIFLPKNEVDCSYHQLQYHSSNHEKYNGAIIKQFKKKVANNLDKIYDKQKPHEGMSVKLMEQFGAIADSQFIAISDPSKAGKRLD